MNLIKYIKQCFDPPVIETPMSEQQRVAMLNLVQVAKERLWLASSYPKKPEPSFDYTENITLEDETRIKQSIQTICDMVHQSDTQTQSH